MSRRKKLQWANPVGNQSPSFIQSPWHQNETFCIKGTRTDEGERGSSTAAFARQTEPPISNWQPQDLTKRSPCEYRFSDRRIWIKVNQGQGQNNRKTGHGTNLLETNS